MHLIFGLALSIGGILCFIDAPAYEHERGPWQVTAVAAVFIGILTLARFRWAAEMVLVFFIVLGAGGVWLLANPKADLCSLSCLLAGSALAFSGYPALRRQLRNKR
jgi:uncharacterized membrane protein HdeD (DUF308 family)